MNQRRMECLNKVTAAEESRSLKERINKTGEMTEPCGAPAVID